MISSKSLPSFNFKSKYVDGITGVLEKKGHFFKTWRSRYFVLSMQTCTLRYFSDTQHNDLKGGYRITLSSTVEICQSSIDGREFVVSLRALKLKDDDDSKTSGVETLYVCCENEDDRTKWYEALTDAIHGGYRKITNVDIWPRSFTPHLDFKINYPEFVVDDVQVIDPANALNAPNVNFNSEETGFYTLLMVDLDNHKDDGSKTQYLHWAILNIPGKDIKSGSEVRKYAPPMPTYGSGYHRFVFVVFAQSRQCEATMLDTLKKFTNRSDFSLFEFSNRLNIGEPIAIKGFFSTWNDLVDDLHHRNGYIPAKRYLSPKQAVEYDRIVKQELIEQKKRELCINHALRDIIDTFAVLSPSQYPSIGLEITYSYNGMKYLVDDGNSIPAVATVSPPSVHLSSCGDGELYTLILADPDTPSRSKPDMREFIHWVVANINTDDLSSSGDVLLPYVGMGPPYGSGPHRYAFFLYKQTNRLSSAQIQQSSAHLSARAGLKSANWARSVGLREVPVGIALFISEWDDSVDALHAEMGWTPPKAYLSPKQRDSYVEDEAGLAEMSELDLHDEFFSSADDICGAVFEKKSTGDLMYKKRFVGIDRGADVIYWSKDAMRAAYNSATMKSVPMSSVESVDIRPTSSMACIHVKLNDSELSLMLKGRNANTMCFQFGQLLRSMIHK